VFAAAAITQLATHLRRSSILVWVLVLLAATELATMPLVQFRDAEPIAAAYKILATLPRGAVLELPYWYERSDFPRHAHYMLNSTAHWQPLMNGYSDHIPADFRKTVVALSSFPSRESFGIVGKAGGRYVVFHLDMYDPRLRQRLFERLTTYSAYLRPLSQEGTVWLYEIVDWPN